MTRCVASDEMQHALNMTSQHRHTYYSRLRADVLAHVPTWVTRVLSVGCGAGLTEHELVRQGIDVVGIEENPDAAAAARRQGLTVLEGSAVTVNSEIETRRFDCLIYADVLEHIADPLAVLRLHVERLDAGGAVIISVPNFRHFEVFWHLFLRGHVPYADAGILDRTHVRLTTRKLIHEWVQAVGLRTATVEYRMSRRREKLLAKASIGLLCEFVARQIIVVAEKPRAT